MEYEYALKTKKPIVSFLHADPSSIPDRHVEHEQEARRMLEQFRDQAKTRMCTFWLTPQDLGAKVTRSIVTLQKTRPSPGWIRASSNNPYLNLDKTVQSLELQTANIERRLIPAFKEENSKFLKRIEHQIGLAKRDQNMGLTASYLNTIEFDFKSLLLDGVELYVVMNDGQTWLSQHDELLVKRLADRRKRTTFVFVHPDSPMVELLAKKTGTDRSIYRNRIIDSITRIEAISPLNASVRILGHYLVPHLAAFLTEHRAYVTLYMHASRPTRPPSGFEFEKTTGTDCYYSRLGEDIQDLISVAVDVSPFANGGKHSEA